MVTKMMNSQSCQVTENRNKNKNRNTKKPQNTTTDLMQVVDFSSSCVIEEKISYGREEIPDINYS